MKIQCDVCGKEEALVFCSADEAALCNGCDHRVHHANKLASKHHRFSLLNPANKDAPRCDVCQERRAFLFCREDRAILCRECDIPIHTANEHTQKHNRFLLTGVKLASCNPTSSSNGCDDSQKVNNKSQSLIKSTPPQTSSTTSIPSKGGGGGGGYVTTSGGSTSSIAEYLIETLPGWHVEDFLDSSSVAAHGFCKNDDLLPFLDTEVETNLGSFSSDDLCMWVPQVPNLSDQINSINEKKTSPKMNNKRWSDNGFTVPSISPSSNKRSRSFW
ncbi:B-box zinc finger protein [Thalictrum thalictroides]|uniref:B-box zinc finger protein n=1 Tax=Thalictrum thalictroides TaxID=46969 RepID=A0A7J6UXS3_THATH|nr:B-box zinc finger protein [Thalictrum thalictroides]